MKRFPVLSALSAVILMTAAASPDAFAERSDEDLQKFVEDHIQAVNPKFKLSRTDIFKEDYARAVPLLLPWFEKAEYFHGDLYEPLSCPAQRAFHLLKPEDQPQTIPKILPYAQSPEKLKRSVAGRLLAWLPRPEVKDAVIALLADKDPAVVWATANVIEQRLASAEDTAYQKFAAQYFDALVPYASSAMPTQELGPGGWCSAMCLMRIDSGKAAALFNRPEILRKDNPLLFQILDALNHGKAVVSDSGLLRQLYLDRTARGSARVKVNDPDDNAIIALRALTIAHAPQAANWIKERLEIPFVRFQGEEGAWEFRHSRAVNLFLDINGFRVHGIDFLHRQCLADPARFEKLSRVQKTGVLAHRVALSLWERNKNITKFSRTPAGSLYYYLVENRPADYQPAVAALRELGSQKSSSLLASGLKAIASTPMPDDRAGREAALQRIGDQATRTLVNLVREMLAADLIDVRILNYMLKNRKEFPDPSPEEIEALEKAEKPRAGKEDEPRIEEWREKFWN